LVSINHALASLAPCAQRELRALQVSLAEGAALQHGYVQLEAARGAAHTKSTLVQQAERSSYTLTEACLGGQLARHDVNVEQVCPL
jgi:Fe-S cluster assembly protein SufD